MADPAAPLVQALESLRASIEEQNQSLTTITQTLQTMHERVTFLEGLALDHEKRLKELGEGR
jgi:predicted nuclease with TOPRIM domain